MSDKRWRVRLTTFTEWLGNPHKFVAEKGHAHLFGETIAEVMDLIAFHEGERP